MAAICKAEEARVFILAVIQVLVSIVSLAVGQDTKIKNTLQPFILATTPPLVNTVISLLLKK